MRFPIRSGAAREVLTTARGTMAHASAAAAAVTEPSNAVRILKHRRSSQVLLVGEFAVNGGNLTELTGSPVSLPTGATPAGIVVN